MASRENTAIHVALILLVMTTIAGAVCAFMFSSQAKTKVSEANQALRKQQEAELKYRAAYYKVQLLKYLIGDASVDRAQVTALESSVSDDQVADVKAMEAQFEQFVKEYGFGLTAENINYRNLPGNILAALKQRNDNAVEAQKRVDALVIKNTAEQATAAKNIATADARATAAETDAKAEKGAFDKERAAFVQKQQAAQNVHVAAAQRMKKENTDLANAVVAETKVRKRAETLNKAFAEERARQNVETFEVPDGRVTGVDPVNKVAFINLGSIDGLRTGITFSVYPQKAIGITRKREEIKAEIEVIEVIDQRLARCKILSQQSIRDPIEPLDQIHTPAWRPGRKIHFALVGNLDIDGDGSADNETVKSLIHKNNGVIDAELGMDGKKIGKISLKTRYIVKGETVDSIVTSKDYRTFMDEARYHGVQPITVGEFLSYMGWSNQVRTVSMGRGSRSDDFREKRNLRTSDQPQQNFRPRQPPKRGKKGAF